MTEETTPTDFDTSLFFNATYDAADDKLRLYHRHRLPPEDYNRMKEAGFNLAPKQGCFYAVWSPSREDIALGYCGDISDEDTTLEERAEARANRFQGYNANATQSARAATDAVKRIADNIPFGQPILVGHHSERRARKDAERIETGMRRAVDEFHRAEYWKDRAASTIRHAARRDRPDVVYRRIRKLEAEVRKWEREKAQTGTGTFENWKQHIEWYFPKKWAWVKDLPEDEQRAERQKGIDRFLSHCDRWISHLENRLIYERAIYEDAGGAGSDKAGKPLEVGGAVLFRDAWLTIRRVNKSGGSIVSVSTDPHPRWGWKRREIISFEDIKDIRTKAENSGITPEKETEDEISRIEAETRRIEAQIAAQKKREEERAEVAPLEATLQAGVQVVVQNELFPTPAPLALRVAKEALWGDIRMGDESFIPRILEPEAGGAAILKAVREILGERPAEIDFCEINTALAKALEAQGNNRAPLGWKFVHSDFLEYHPGPVYDFIVMNPPFSQEIAHVRHAYECLAPRGILVAIVSESPFFNSHRAAVEFRAWLGNLSSTEETLPPGSFQASGTGVNTRLISIYKPE